MEWKEVRLGDVCEIYGRIGFRGYTTNDLVDTPNEGAISLSPKNIINGELNLEQCTYIKWDKYYESPEIMINPNEIVITKTGSSVGRTTFVRRVEHPMTLNPQLVVLKNISGNAEFLSYYIKSALFQSVLKSIVVGSAIPTLSQKNLANLKINVPKEVDDQHRIASILSSLDRKIELNNKINADLEEMAQAIFKNWFVDFEPFKDGKFVDSELGMIPEGWKVGRLVEIADVVGGSTPSKAKPEYYTQNGIAWLTPKDLSNHPAVYSSRGEIDITEEGYNSTSTKLMPKGTVLFTSRAPIGYISIAQNDICTNQGFKSLVPKKAGTCFLYCFLKYVTPEIENKSTGSTFKEASGSLMKSLQVIMPEQKVFEDFETIVSPLFARIESLEKENTRLSLLRDTLLPRLMSGELEIPE